MQQYGIWSKDLNKVGNHLEECDDDAYDTIAPVTQDIKRQDEDEGCTDTHLHLNETFDYLSDNLGIPSTQPNLHLIQSIYQAALSTIIHKLERTSVVFKYCYLLPLGKLRI